LFSFESSVLAFAHLGASFRVLQAISLAFTHSSKNDHAAPCAHYCYSAKGDSTLQGKVFGNVVFLVGYSRRDWTPAGLLCCQVASPGDN
jgi:hypothetical protein